MTIRKMAGGKYRVLSKKKHKNMGTYDSKAAALAREHQLKRFGKKRGGGIKKHKRRHKKRRT